MMDYRSEVNKYLTLVKEKIESLGQLKAGSLGQFVDLEEAGFNNDLHPRLVLLAAKAYGNLNERIVSLAAVVQYIYTGFSIHKEILQEENEACNREKDFQYPVLVGDYLCSCFFLTLCRSGLAEFLGAFSQVLCQINEASLWRLLHQERSLELDLKIVDGEVGALLGEGCSISSKLTGATEKEQAGWKLFGLRLGRFIGLREQGYVFAQIQKYWWEVQDCLAQLPDGENRRLLEELLEAIKGGENFNGGHPQGI